MAEDESDGSWKTEQGEVLEKPGTVPFGDDGNGSCNEDVLGKLDREADYLDQCSEPNDPDRELKLLKKAKFLSLQKSLRRYLDILPPERMERMLDKYIAVLKSVLEELRSNNEFQDTKEDILMDGLH